ncbi:hypothetical protein KFK09_021645 [Dendrobium nobile]|uniref:Uncharacterized protein n=1 Tax=Dendrobium nobile TaxID=94219 RepID=A0A8T3AQX4_DENNO|nr:hypothetical protein KFK09_021645 [Dendrobium nobile]
MPVQNNVFRDRNFHSFQQNLEVRRKPSRHANALVKFAPSVGGYLTSPNKPRGRIGAAKKKKLHKSHNGENSITHEILLQQRRAAVIIRNPSAQTKRHSRDSK